MWELGVAPPVEPLTFSGLDFWYKPGTRSGLNLPDAMGGSAATIQLPYFYNNTDNIHNYSFLSVFDNGALDIGSSNITLCATVKSENIDKTSYRYLVGKGVEGSTNGRYGFFMNNTTGYLSGYAQPSGGIAIVTSTVDFTTCGAVHLRLMINTSTNKISFYINNVQIDSDLSYTGTFASLDNKYAFMIGGGNRQAGGSDGYVGYCSVSDVWLFSKLLTPTEATTIYNRGIVQGAKAHWPLLGGQYYEYDCSGNNYDLKGYKLSVTSYSYGAMGTLHGLNVGYTLYQNGGANCYVPYLDSGTERINPPMQTTDFIKIINRPGDPLNHNLSNSRITLPSSSWDRSDVSLFTGDARIAMDYRYINTIPKSWHIEELDDRIIYNNAVTGKETKCFSKCGSVTNNDRFGNLELFSYNTNKTGNDLIKIRNYVKDGTIAPVISYVFQSLNIVTQKDNKVVTWDGVRYLKLSLDGGLSITNTIDLPNTIDINNVTTQVNFAHIFSNGNIIFASHTKMYLSTDNFASYAETTVLGIDGNTYSPSLYNNFRPDDFAESPDVNGVEQLVWGCYSNEVGTVSVNINLWETVDNGVTIRSVYKFGVTSPVLSANHIHHTAYNSSDNSWWFCTGDGVGNIHFIKGLRNVGTGVWIFTEQIVNIIDIATSFFYTTFLFRNGYVYLASDDYSRNNAGIWKVKYADILNSAKYVRIYPFNKALFMIGDNSSNELIAGVQVDNRVVFTKDEKLFLTKTLTGGPDLNVGLGVYLPKAIKNTNGYYLLEPFASDEVVRDWDRGSVLQVKII